MKDYTFLTKTMKESFILKYAFYEDKIIVYYADKDIVSFKNTSKNLRQIQDMMKEQIEVAYLKLQQEKDCPEKRKLLNYLKNFILLKIKERDIIKNKLFLDNLNNLQLYSQNKEFLSFFPLSLVKTWNNLENEDGSRKSFTINDASKFSLKEVITLVKTISTIEQKKEEE